VTVTQLDPRTALVVVDLQEGLRPAPTDPTPAEVAGRSAVLARHFREHHLPVVLVTVAGVAPGRTERPGPAREFPPGWTDLMPELGAQPGDLRVTKHRRSAFSGTGLHEQLQALGVTQVVVCGIATKSGVESTARSAYELGYHVTFAVDAMTDPSPDGHRHSLTEVFPRLGETGTVADVVGLLDAPHG
jgi:nicotinamidase-related amidase